MTSSRAKEAHALLEKFVRLGSQLPRSAADLDFDNEQQLSDCALLLREMGAVTKQIEALADEEEQEEAELRRDRRQRKRF